VIVEEIQGNLLDTTVSAIAHGVNCQNTMGSGVAKALFTKWPEIKSKYHDFCNMNGPSHRLSQVQAVNTDDKTILNCFTQEWYGYDGRKYVSYDAIYECFNFISQFYDEVAIPKIGCGLAGGDWNVVKEIINSATGSDCKVYVYYLK